MSAPNFAFLDKNFQQEEDFSTIFRWSKIRG